MREPTPEERRQWEAEFDSFEAVWRRRVDVEGFMVCHPDDIIQSKMAANRVKDRESLPRLRSFRDYWLAKRR